MNEDVKKFYDNNPYPQVSGLAKIKLPQNLFENYCSHVQKPVPEEPELLIVGCGTVAASAIADSYPKARIICAIDISDKTLAIAKKRCSTLNRKKILWINADISDDDLIDKLPHKQFDWIHCTGVLHHLGNPQKGVNNLARLLKNDGIIRFQVYSKGARIWIEWARSLFLSKNAQNTRDVKDILLALTKYHPFRFVLATYPELLRESGLKDGLLHPLVRTLYANEWYNLFKQANLELAYWDKPYLLEDLDTLFPQKLFSKFNSLNTANKITILEELGEWRSDFSGILNKNTISDSTNVPDDRINTDIIIGATDNMSYPRNQLWQMAKSGLKKLNNNIDKSDLEFIFNNLSQREWLSGLNGLLLRLRWSAWEDQCRKLASSNFIFAEKKNDLIEDFFDNNIEIDYIPSAENWPWQQWENGFFAWDW